MKELEQTDKWTTVIAGISVVLIVLTAFFVYWLVSANSTSISKDFRVPNQHCEQLIEPELPNSASNRISSAKVSTEKAALSFRNEKVPVVAYVYRVEGESNSSAKIVKDGSKLPLLMYEKLLLSPTRKASSEQVQFESYFSTDEKVQESKDMVTFLASVTGSETVLYGKPCGTYTVIRYFEILDRLQKNLGSSELSVNSNKQISSISYNTLELAYFIESKKQQFVQPIYVVTGEVTFSDKTKGTIVTRILAIKQNK